MNNNALDRPKWYVTAAFALFCALPLFFVGIRDIYRWGWGTVHATGVIQNRECQRANSRYHPVYCHVEVEYQGANQQTRRITIWAYRGRQGAGDTIRFVYRPAHPDQGEVDSLKDRYLIPLGWLSLGLGLLGGGLFCLRQARRNCKFNIPYLRDNS